jgi:hypothetical protein
MSASAWLVGYLPIVEQEIRVAGQEVTLAADTYALRHTTSALSLIDALDAAMLASVGATTSTTVVLRNRLVRITLSTAGTIRFDDAPALAALLGFPATATASATVHTATYVSPLLWSPGYPATPKTIHGVDGYTIPHQSAYKSDDGSQVYVAHYGDEIWQDLGWSHIMPERMRVADTEDGGGTFHEFFEQVGKYRRRFTYYEAIDEDDASSSAVTWTTGRGPYVLRESDGDWYRRNVPNAEVSCSLELPLHMVAEL